MDNLDTAVTYGIGGGLVCAGVNYMIKDAPPLDRKAVVNYVALFGAMGCLAAALTFAVTQNNGVSPANVGFFGGLVGSYLLLALGTYF